MSELASAGTAPQRDTVASRLPVTLITGYLGAGKTTLVSRLVRHPGMDRVAVIINEIGEIGIDHDLVTMSSENISLLANGCICCGVRTDLQETLRELFGNRRAGLIPDFDRVIIETTGLADPAPVMQTLTTDTMLAVHFRLDGVVTLVDAVNAPTQLAQSPEAERQIALADLVALTKTDLVDAAQTAALREVVNAINPRAAIRPCPMGDIDPEALFGLGLTSARVDERVLRFLNDLDTDAPEAAPGEGIYLGRQQPRRHDPAVKSFSLRFTEPFGWDRFSAAMELVISLRGQDLLRVKGIVNVEGRPTVVQGVGHVFHPPVTLDRWPSDDHGSRLVFIARKLDAAALKAIFAAAVAL